MAEKLNTHYYDGSLKAQFKQLVQIQDAKTDFMKHRWNSNEVLKEIYDNTDKQQLTQQEKYGVERALKLILSDPRGNYDPVNDINVLEILCRTWYFVRREPVEDQKAFYQQLNEINNGTCSQGRTTRIFQIFYTYF
jgi:hypothetical protein